MSELTPLDTLGRDLGGRVGMCVVVTRSLGGTGRCLAPDAPGELVDPGRDPQVAIAAVLVAALAGGAAWAASGGGAPDPAPPPATKDVLGLVSLARPITPIAVASTPPGALEMRITEPGGRRRAVLVFRETRTRTGRRVDRVCAIPAPESQLRALRRAFGNCIDQDGGEPWAIITGSSSDRTVTIGRLASDRVQRLTFAGPGGTFVVPRSRSGAFLVVYGGRAKGPRRRHRDAHRRHHPLPRWIAR